MSTNADSAVSPTILGTVVFGVLFVCVTGMLMAAASTESISGSSRYWALEFHSGDRGTVASRRIATSTPVDYKENPTSRTEVFEMIRHTT